jgi:hypothetical protein
LHLSSGSPRTTTRGRPDAHPGRSARSAAAAVVLAAGLTLTACGGSSTSPAAPTILNTEKIERAIEHSALVQRNERAAVSCPSGVHQKQGIVFSCTALVGRTSTQFIVTELNGSGDVHYAAH